MDWEVLENLSHYWQVGGWLIGGTDRLLRELQRVGCHFAFLNEREQEQIGKGSKQVFNCSIRIVGVLGLHILLENACR